MKNSLAEPVDFFHYKGRESWQHFKGRESWQHFRVGSVVPFPQLHCGPAPGRPKPARLTEPGRVHERCAQRIAYTRPA